MELRIKENDWKIYSECERRWRISRILLNEKISFASIRYSSFPICIENENVRRYARCWCCWCCCHTAIEVPPDRLKSSWIRLIDSIRVIDKEKELKSEITICHIILYHDISLKFEFNSVVVVVAVYALHIFCPFSCAFTKCVRIHACKIEIAHTHKHSAANQMKLCGFFCIFFFLFCSKLGKWSPLKLHLRQICDDPQPLSITRTHAPFGLRQTNNTHSQTKIYIYMNRFICTMRAHTKYARGSDFVQTFFSNWISIKSSWIRSPSNAKQY